MQLKRVVLPAPLGPMMPTISHSPTCSWTSARACTPPKRMETESISSTDIGDLHLLLGAGVDVEAAAEQPAPHGRDLLAQPTREHREGEEQEERSDHQRHELRRELHRVGEEPLESEELEQDAVAHEGEERRA